MADNYVDGYGYQDDTVPVNGPYFEFGLNAVTCKGFKLDKNSGKDGAPGIGLEVTFALKNNPESVLNVKYFEIDEVKIFDTKGQESGKTRDKSHPAFQKEIKKLNASLIHLMKVFVPEAQLKAALSVPVDSFEAHCVRLGGLLPANYKEMPLFCFAQYQTKNRSGSDRKFLELPRNLNNGTFLMRAIQGDIKEMRNSDFNASQNEVAFWYEDSAGNRFFGRGTKFMQSNNASATKGLTDATGMPVNVGNAGTYSGLPVQADQSLPVVDQAPATVVHTTPTNSFPVSDGTIPFVPDSPVSNAPSTTATTPPITSTTTW